MQRKMKRKGLPPSEIFDARALRLVVDDAEGEQLEAAIAACYKLMPAVHRLWRPINGESDDYIATPKGSGYQSLHTAVLGPGGVPLEIQLRTSSMHETAEYGRAAHWAYKEFAPPVQQAPEGTPQVKARLACPAAWLSTTDAALLFPALLVDPWTHRQARL